MIKVKTRRTIAFVISLLMCFSLISCGEENETVNIVVAAPMTGSMAQWGEAMQNGAQLAVDQWNENGGVLGKEITLDFEDDQGDPTEAASVAQKITASDKYVGVIGHYTTSCTLAASPTYQSAGLPEIAVASTNPGSTSAGDYIFRVNPTNTAQGRGIVEWVVNEHGKTKIAILYVNNDYGKGMFDIASETVTSLSAELVYSAAISAEGEEDYSVILTNIKDSGAEALVLLNYYADNAKVVMQMDRLGLDILTVSSDGTYSPDFISLAGESCEGTYVATWFHPDNQLAETQDFLTAYKEAFSIDSDTWAPYAYDATNILLTAIENAGSLDREDIKNELSKTQNFSGATGNITFNEERVPDTTQMKLLFTRIEDGNYVLIQ